MQHLADDLVSGLYWHEGDTVKAVVQHSNLPQRQAYMVLPQLVYLGIAHAAMS